MASYPPKKVPNGSRSISKVSASYTTDNVCISAEVWVVKRLTEHRFWEGFGPVKHFFWSGHQVNDLINNCMAHATCVLRLKIACIYCLPCFCFFVCSLMVFSPKSTRYVNLLCRCWKMVLVN